MGLGQWLQFAYVLRLLRGHLVQVGGECFEGVGAALGVHADEAHLPVLGQIAVVGAQPLDEVEHLLGAPSPKSQAGMRRVGSPVPWRT